LSKVLSAASRRHFQVNNTVRRAKITVSADGSGIVSQAGKISPSRVNRATCGHVQSASGHIDDPWADRVAIRHRSEFVEGGQRPAGRASPGDHRVRVLGLRARPDLTQPHRRPRDQPRSAPARRVQATTGTPSPTHKRAKRGYGCARLILTLERLVQSVF
jgi:hypothetical protein